MGLEMSVRGNGDGRRMRRREEGKFPFMKKVGVRVSEWLAWAPLSSLWQSAQEYVVNVPCAWALGAGVGTPRGQIFQSTFVIAWCLPHPAPRVTRDPSTSEEGSGPNRLSGNGWLTWVC